MLWIAALAALIYAATAVWTPRAAPSLTERGLLALALLLHATALWQQVFQPTGLSIGLSEAASLFAWQAAALLWVFCWREPLRPLGVAIYPVAAVFAVWAVLQPTPLRETHPDWALRAHILMSLLSAGLLTLAAVQAVALAIQERLLHGHRPPGPLLRSLPPLQTMERLLFQLIAVGFVLLSLTLLSGLGFLRDWLAQHLAHKTVLSITAWLLFGVLLWGRWRYGWRGKTATRWTLAGYAMLILAYFGSKLVLEIILQKHWV